MSKIVDGLAEASRVAKRVQAEIDRQRGSTAPMTLGEMNRMVAKAVFKEPKLCAQDTIRQTGESMPGDDCSFGQLMRSGMDPIAADFSTTQRATAERLGYGNDVDAMNMVHDALHGALCHFLSIPSYALKQARGEALTEVEQALADIEEEAVMATQRLQQMHRNAANVGDDARN